MAARKPKKDWDEDMAVAVARLSRGKSKFLRFLAFPQVQEKQYPVRLSKPTHIRHSSALEILTLRPAAKPGHRRIPSMPVLDMGKTKGTGEWLSKGVTERKPSRSKLTSRQNLVRFERLPLMNTRCLKAIKPIPDLFPLPPCTDLSSPMLKPELLIPSRLEARQMDVKAMVSPIGRMEQSCNCDQTLEMLYDTLRSATK
jgi:hypothetical protein